MNPTGRFAIALIVSLTGQQALLGQVGPGYSSPYPEYVDATSPTVLQPSRSNQSTASGWRNDWTSLPDASPRRVENVQPAVWDDASDPRLLQTWKHRTGLFGGYLYLTARDVDLAYATHVDGPIQNAVPLAPSAVVAPDYEPGLRVGGVYALDSWSSLTATYWYYRSATSDSLVLPGGTGWIRPEVTHPDTPAADFDKLAAAADYEINFQMVDAAYKAILLRDSNYSVNYLVGLRYAHLDQQFHGAFTVLGERTVDTDIQFNGLGARVGLDGEQLVGRGFLVYGQAFGNLLAGRFSADFQQQFNLAGVEATAGFEDHRIVPQLELELGLGWQDSCGKLRVRAGYYVGAWFNIATTPTWIDAVQANNVTEVNESLLFDGMSIRVEYRF